MTHDTCSTLGSRSCHLQASPTLRAGSHLWALPVSHTVTRLQHFPVHLSASHNRIHPGYTTTCRSVWVWRRSRSSIINGAMAGCEPSAVVVFLMSFPCSSSPPSVSPAAQEGKRWSLMYLTGVSRSPASQGLNSFPWLISLRQPFAWLWFHGSRRVRSRCRVVNVVAQRT